MNLIDEQFVFGKMVALGAAALAVAFAAIVFFPARSLALRPASPDRPQLGLPSASQAMKLSVDPAPAELSREFPWAVDGVRRGADQRPCGLPGDTGGMCPGGWTRSAPPAAHSFRGAGGVCPRCDDRGRAVRLRPCLHRGVPAGFDRCSSWAAARPAPSRVPDPMNRLLLLPLLALAACTTRPYPDPDYLPGPGESPPLAIREEAAAVRRR